MSEGRMKNSWEVEGWVRSAEVKVSKAGKEYGSLTVRYPGGKPGEFGQFNAFLFGSHLSALKTKIDTMTDAKVAITGRMGASSNNYMPPLLVEEIRIIEAGKPRAEKEPEDDDLPF